MPWNAKGDRKDLYLALGGLGLFLVSVIGLCRYYDKIKVISGIFNAAGKFTREVRGTIYIPLVFFFVLLVFFYFWMTTFAKLITTGELDAESEHPIAVFHYNEKLKLSIWLFVLMLFWITNFIGTLNRYIISHACAIWYFNQGEEIVQRNPIL